MRRAKKKQRVDTIEKLAVLMADGFEQVDKRFEQVDRRFEQVDRRFVAIETRLDRIERELADIHRRIDRLEEQGARQAGYSKEIDYLLGRMSRIEKYLKLA